MSKRQHDYVKACDEAMYGDAWRANTKKVLRKLVREAVAWTYGPNADPAMVADDAKQAAKELIP